MAAAKAALRRLPLAEDRIAIDADLGLGEDVDCGPNPEKLACRIGVHRQDDDRNQWLEYWEWLKTGAERFEAVFS